MNFEFFFDFCDPCAVSRFEGLAVGRDGFHDLQPAERGESLFARLVKPGSQRRTACRPSAPSVLNSSMRAR